MTRLARNGFAFLALITALAVLPPTAAAQIEVFSTGQYGTPETISLVPLGFGAYEGSYFIPDFRLANIWIVPHTGGPPTPFLPAPLGDPGSIQSGLFLPPGWGQNSVGYLLAMNFMRVFDSAGNSTLFDAVHSGAFTLPLLAPAGYGTFGGNLFVSDQNGFIWRAEPPSGELAVFKDLTGSPCVNDPFGMEFTPGNFGAFSNRLMASHTLAGSVVAVAPDGTESLFANLPLADGQTGLRQMLMTPGDYFMDALGIPGPLLLLSVSGSNQGGGTLGALVALDSTGTVVAHLREGGILQKFDPRGMVMTDDAHILISDTSDPILRVSAGDFIAGPAAGTLTELSPAHLWIGLKNSDDQGTQFDLKVEFLRNGTPVAEGLKRCITGVTRNPSLAKEAVASFDPFDPVVVRPGMSSP
jgi:hypothetical protein